MTEKNKIPQEIVQGLKALAAAKDKDVKELLGELKEIIKNDEACQMMDNSQAKIRFGFSILARKYSGASGKPYAIYPLLTPDPRRINTKKGERVVCDLSCLVVPLTEEDKPDGKQVFALGNFWDDAALACKGLERGKVYKATLMSADNKFGKKIFGKDIEFEEITGDFGFDFDSYFNEEIDGFCEEINLENIDISVSNDETDVKLVRTWIEEADAGENDKGTYAYYRIVDNSSIGKFDKTIFLHADDLEFGQSSIIIVGLTIQKSGEDNVFTKTVFVKGTKDSIPYNLIPKRSDEDTVDVDLDNEGEKEPSEKETEKEESKQEEDDSDVFSL